MRRTPRSRGQSLVEFALVAPILLLLLSGGADLARAYFVGIQIADGARQAALYASDNPPVNGVSPSGYTPTELEAIAKNNAGSTAGLLGCPSADITVTVGSTTAYGSSGSFYQPISVSCALPLLTPLLPSPVHIASKAEALIVPAS
ncbi:MAG: pilus assembly protein [Candidatus Dormibacteraeota bacterium]|nr:pilus assembly protein [Candidatus Dormibacteraeota bacterium]